MTRSSLTVERDATYVRDLCCAARCNAPHEVEVVVRVGAQERTVRMCERHARSYVTPS